MKNYTLEGYYYSIAKHSPLQFNADVVLSWLKRGEKNGLFHGECWMQLEGKLFPVCQKCSGRLDLGTLPCGKMYKPKKLIETVYSLTIMKIILRQSPQCVDILIWKERMLL